MTIAATALAVALTSLAAPAQAEVGPIYLGESIKAVQQELGLGWRGAVRDTSGNKGTALVYTDGVDQLQIWIQSDRDTSESVEGIVARENRAQGGAFVRPTVLRSWRWPGGTIFEMPRELSGWRVDRSASTRSEGEIVSYEYPDGVVVWFTRNAWSGIDFHTFAD
ncbi:MAG TPA: hypothetical protein VEV38_10460 [Candidatus Eremiobacteraceae bacterium]|nr:hypothetical protein [Candidatus Eremiobacteraceae bacterium]